MGRPNGHQLKEALGGLGGDPAFARGQKREEEEAGAMLPPRAEYTLGLSFCCSLVSVASLSKAEPPAVLSLRLFLTYFTAYHTS